MTATACSDALVIEVMRLCDLAEVVRIEKRSFSAPWPLEAYRHELEANRNATYYVARLRGVGEAQAGPARPAVVGYAGLWTQVDEVHISTIAVHPDFRRRGIGERLLQRLILHAGRCRARLITLEVRVSNDLARRLYRKYGFRQVGVRKGYYADNQEDAIIMSTPPLDDPLWQARFRELVARM